MGETNQPLGRLPLILAAGHLVLAAAGAIAGNWPRAGLQLLLTMLWAGWYFWFRRRDAKTADHDGRPASTSDVS